MSNIYLVCPQCLKRGFVEVSKENVKDSSRSLITLDIGKKVICSHELIVFLDQNLSVRECMVIDFKVETPELSLTQKPETFILPEREKLDLDLIKLNFTAIELVYLLKSMFYKQKIVLISELDFLFNHFQNFFNFITQDNFQTDITIIKENEFKNEENIYKNSMIFKDNKIVNNYLNLIDLKDLSFEKKIITNFLREIDVGMSLLYIKNEITKVYEFSRNISDYINSHNSDGKNPNKANLLKVKNELEKYYGIKINTQYFHFLIGIVKNYFGTEVPSLSTSLLSLT